MAKVLVSDIEDILIPYQSNYRELLYGKNSDNYNETKSYATLKIQLEHFFEAGNKLAIVTNQDHTNLNTLLNSDLKKIYEALKEYENLITIYLSGRITNEKDMRLISESNLCDITTIGEKEHVFNYIDDRDEVFCIGNESSHISLLKKGLEYGGTSSFIYHQLLDPNFINQKSFITLLANERIHTLTEQEAAAHQLSNVAKVQLEKRLWLNLVEPIKREIENELKFEKKTYIDVIKEWYLRKQINSYYTLNRDSKNILNNIDYLVANIKVYNSFHEYNELVLQPKKNI